MLLRNPIVSRVRRHATVATLFRAVGPPLVQRAAEPASQPPVAAARPAAARVAVVQATLLPAATSLPTGYVTGVPPAPVEADVGVAPPVQRSPVAAEAMPPSAMQPSTPPAEGPAVQPSPAAPPEEEPTFSEAVWRRLQTIFRRHQESQATTETPPEADPSSAPAQPGPTPRETSPVQRTTDQPSSQPRTEEAVPPPLAREPLPTETASAPPPPHGPPIQRAVDETGARPPAAMPDTAYPADTAYPMDTIEPPPTTAPTVPEFAPAEEETPAERRTIEPESDERAALPATAETPIVQPSRASTPTDHPTTQPPDQLTIHPSPSQAERGLSHEISPEPTPGPSVEGETAAIEPQWQPRPLQDVWPVQRLEAPPMPPEPPARSASAPAGLEPEPSPASGEEVTTREEIQRALTDVAPGQPTASSIEVITPRQPRPAPRPEASVPLEAEGARPEADIPPDVEESRPALLEEPFVISRAAEPAKPGSPQDLSGEATLPPPTVQMQPEDEADTQARPLAEMPAPDLVQTEIGPLPADLWHLLGRSPPGQEPAETISPQGPPQDMDQEATVADAISTDGHTADARVARAVAAAEAPTRPERPAIREIIPPVVQRAAETRSPIQREPEEEQAATESVATEAAATEAVEQRGTEAETPTPRIDVDDLARRVYAEIKRRLSTEWERARRMF